LRLCFILTCTPFASRKRDPFVPSPTLSY